MRLRTGHGANDWTENDPGGFARLSGHSGGSIHGELVRGGESEQDRNRRYQREHMRRFRAKTVDMNDYQRENRWDGKPRCGKPMPQAGELCARMPGHRKGCKTAYALENQRRKKSAA